MPNFNWKIFF